MKAPTAKKITIEKFVLAFNENMRDRATASISTGVHEKQGLSLHIRMKDDYVPNIWVPIPISGVVDLKYYNRKVKKAIFNGECKSSRGGVTMRAVCEMPDGAWVMFNLPPVLSDEIIKHLSENIRIENPPTTTLNGPIIDLRK
jgi:hypothetical protein